jgi:hydrogenase/urease accessory protein HupE
VSRSAPGRGVAALVACVCAWPDAAIAHGTLQAGEFYTGLSQPLFHPEALLSLCAVLLWTSQQGEPAQHRLAFAFCAALLAGCAAAWIGWSPPGAVWVQRTGALGLGLLVAARLPLPGPLAYAIVATVGLAQGLEAIRPDLGTLQRPWLYALGLAGAALVLWGWLVVFTERFRAFWAQVAVRVVGSWIATVTLLVSALALARR